MGQELCQLNQEYGVSSVDMVVELEFVIYRLVVIFLLPKIH